MVKISIKRVESHFLEFYSRYKLQENKDNAVVAVSGGVDSIFLAYMMQRLQKRLKIKSLRFVYINHGTRPKENLTEQNFVRDFGNSLNIKVEVFNLDLNLEDSNFENNARTQRKEIYKLLSTNYKANIFLGHHIDDSYEWSLMQQFKSSNPNTQYGIPVKNGIYRRPLMCFTKEQIHKICNDLEIQFIQDSSNLNLKFERNYVRHKIIPQIKKRFPSYLKHYVERSNRQLSNSGKIINFNISNNITLLVNKNFSNDFSDAKEIIYSSIIKLSSSKRGTLGKQVNNLISSHLNNKSGPLSFSGDVKAFMIPGVIVVTNIDGLKELMQIDQHILDQMTIDKVISYDRNIYENLLCTEEFSLLNLIFMNPPIWPKDKKFKKVTKPHPLLPKTTTKLIQDNTSWQWVTRYYALGLDK